MRAAPRQSNRINEVESTRVLDDVSRERRLRKQLEALEQDNFHEDPHAQLQWHKNIPKFDDEQQEVNTNRKPDGEPAKKRRKFRAEHSKQRFRKNFVALVEEETLNRSVENSGLDAYNAARAPPSCLPARHFCTACGFFSKYSCVRCGARYCSIPCRDLHNDTRCLKWTI